MTRDDDKPAKPDAATRAQLERWFGSKSSSDKAPSTTEPATDARPEPTVKQLLEGAGLTAVVDAATRAELERLFGPPTLKPEAPAPKIDPLVAEAIERRDKALAGIDAAFLGRIDARIDRYVVVLKPRHDIDVHVDPSIAQVDLAMVDRQHLIAEPRDYERPDGVVDDLKDCTPQALLRDLHRPELTFDKQFEITDALAELRVDVARVVGEAMTTSWKLAPPAMSLGSEGKATLADLRKLRATPWAEIRMVNRKVTE